MYLSRQLTILSFVLYWYKSWVSLVKTFPIIDDSFHQFYLKNLAFLLWKVCVSPLLLFSLLLVFLLQPQHNLSAPPMLGQWKSTDPEQGAPRRCGHLGGLDGKAWGPPPAQEPLDFPAKHGVRRMGGTRVPGDTLDSVAGLGKFLSVMKLDC